VRSKIILIMLLTATAIGTAGCNSAVGQREAAGTIIGAAVGGLIGSQFGGNTGARIAAGFAGATIGGLIGNRIGSYLDEKERQQLAAITRETAMTGKPRSFTSLRTGARVKTRLANTSVNDVGDTCRTVVQEILLPDGTSAMDTVKACRSNGQWQI